MLVCAALSTFFFMCAAILDRVDMLYILTLIYIVEENLMGKLGLYTQNEIYIFIE
jgi:hypothetical protein